MDRLTDRSFGITYLKGCFDECDHPNSGCDCERVGTALVKLYRYENTGFMPAEITPHLRELAQADREGRVVVLPCKVGDTVYTIDEDLFDCEHCKFQSEANPDPEYHRLSCKFPEDRHCPYSIEEHVTEGFDVEDGGVSGPGEWGYEGLELFTGIDGKWYKTREAAEKELEAMK